MALAIGIDLGATKVAAAIVDRSGAILERERTETPRTSADAIVERLKQMADTLLDRRDLVSSDLVGIGVGAPGPITWPEGEVLAFPNLPVPGFPLRARLQQATGIRTLLDNDANLAAWGEKRFGAGRASSHMVCITVGTGIGGGLIIDNRPFRGSRGAGAEIGHMVIGVGGPPCACGNYGCLEAYTSGQAVARYARDFLDMDRDRTSSLWERIEGDLANLTSAMVTEEAFAGDDIAKKVYERVGCFLGVGIANLINLFNPDLVVIGGGVTEAAGELLLEPARREAANRALAHAVEMAPIVPAQLGNDAGILGAAALVL